MAEPLGKIYYTLDSATAARKQAVEKLRDSFGKDALTPEAASSLLDAISDGLGATSSIKDLSEESESEKQY